ncbi:MAG: TatD family hydrolase [Parcubacteria group bacterium]|nr:TatD family hydrolase [Parcubacteria group bacterium]
MLIDTHAHLNFPDLQKDIEKVLENAAQAGVEKIINVGVTPKTSEEVVAFAET